MHGFQVYITDEGMLGHVKAGGYNLLKRSNYISLSVHNTSAVWTSEIMNSARCIGIMAVLI